MRTVRLFFFFKDPTKINKEYSSLIKSFCLKCYVCAMGRSIAVLTRLLMTCQVREFISASSFLFKLGFLCVNEVLISQLVWSFVQAAGEMIAQD
jgi:hypothetical protein